MPKRLKYLPLLCSFLQEALCAFWHGVRQASPWQRGTSRVSARKEAGRRRVRHLWGGWQMVVGSAPMRYRRSVYVTYGIIAKELVIREIKIDEAASLIDSDSRMTCF